MTREVTSRFENVEVGCAYPEAWSPLEMGWVEKDSEKVNTETGQCKICCEGAGMVRQLGGAVGSRGWSLLLAWFGGF